MKFFILLSATITLTGCMTTNNTTQVEANRINNMCKMKFSHASRKGETDRWSEWSKCKKHSIMPIEIEEYDLSKAEIEAAYDNLINSMLNLEKERTSLSVAEFQRKLDQIYNTYDKEKSALNIRTCILWVDSGDGSGSKVCELWA